LDGSFLASAQDVVCACNPRLYAWRINFDNDCTNFSYDTTGIDFVSCAITNEQGVFVSQRDFDISSVDTFIFAELGPQPGIFRNIQQLFNENIQQTGELVDFPSLIDPDKDFTSQATPFGIRLVAFATSTQGETLRLDVEISFTNVCEKEPVFTDGNVFAWFEYDAANSGDIIPEFCALPSQAPSVSSAPSPTVIRQPSRGPTLSPTRFKSSKSGKSSKSNKSNKSGKSSKSNKSNKSSKSYQYRNSGKGKGKGKGKGSSTRSPTRNWTSPSKGGKSESSKYNKSKQYKR
jgi:hypothetical protein